jgi:hypothetical protein
VQSIILASRFGHILDGRFLKRILGAGRSSSAVEAKDCFSKNMHSWLSRRIRSRFCIGPWQMIFPVYWKSFFQRCSWRFFYIGTTLRSILVMLESFLATSRKNLSELFHIDA